MRDTLNFVNDTFKAVAADTAGWDRGRILDEPSPGRFLVELDAGAQIVVSNSSDCFDPTVGQRVDLSKVNGILSIAGASA